MRKNEENVEQWDTVYALLGGKKGSCFARDTDRGLYRERVWNGKPGESGDVLF